MTFSDHYEGSHGSRGGYNTADDGLNLPNYTDHDPPSNNVISQVDVLEEVNEAGYSRDSDDKYRDVKTSRSRHLLVE